MNTLPLAPFLGSNLKFALSPLGSAPRKRSTTFASMEGKVVDSNEKHVVVCGGGVIGVCTAYYLSKKGVNVTIVERCGIACAASGKAGGFLALDWSRGPLKQLGQTSFNLHAQLASELGREYGYRRVNTLSATMWETTSVTSKKPHKDLPPWVDGNLRDVSIIGNQNTTAQVHPRLFTQALYEAAVETGKVKLVLGEVKDIQLTNANDDMKTTSKVVQGVTVNGELLTADSVVIAMGPWSGKNPLVRQLAEISGLKAHSIVLRPSDPKAITGHPLFLQYRTVEGKFMEPEVYPRPTGEVYVCGMSEEVPVPDDPNQVVLTAGSCTVLQRVAANVSSHLEHAELITEQACFLPCSPDGVPLIGAIPNVRGVFVGTGHSCWGILNAPATGLALAQLIADGKSMAVNLDPFDPARFLG